MEGLVPPSVNPFHRQVPHRIRAFQTGRHRSSRSQVATHLAKAIRLKASLRRSLQSQPASSSCGDMVHSGL